MGGFCLLVELHRKGSAPAACTEGLFYWSQVDLNTLWRPATLPACDTNIAIIEKVSVAVMIKNGHFSKLAQITWKFKDKYVLKETTQSQKTECKHHILFTVQSVSVDLVSVIRALVDYSKEKEEKTRELKKKKTIFEYFVPFFLSLTVISPLKFYL